MRNYRLIECNSKYLSGFLVTFHSLGYLLRNIFNICRIMFRIENVIQIVFIFDNSARVYAIILLRRTAPLYYGTVFPIGDEILRGISSSRTDRRRISEVFCQ